MFLFLFPLILLVTMVWVTFNINAIEAQKPRLKAKNQKIENEISYQQFFVLCFFSRPAETFFIFDFLFCLEIF